MQRMKKMDEEKKIPILKHIDVAQASFEAKNFAEILGFKGPEQYMIATAASELGTNIIKYAKRGVIILRRIKKDNGVGIEIIAKDQGPGIEDIERALKDDFSTSKSLGLGLPGVKRFMDEFIIDSRRDADAGTRIVTRKWIKSKNGR